MIAARAGFSLRKLLTKLVRAFLPLLWFASVTILFSANDAQAGTTTYTPGAYTFSVPTGVTRIQTQVAGGGGGGGGPDVNAGGSGGQGGLITFTLSVTPGQVITGTVGSGGGGGSGSTCGGSRAAGTGYSNGGAGGLAGCSGSSGNGGGGGGSSSLSLAGTNLAQAAGAGGGGGATSSGGNGFNGSTATASTTSTTCGTVSAGTNGGDLGGGDGGGGGGGGGFVGGSGGSSSGSDSGRSPGGGAGTSCYSTNAAIATAAFASTGGAGGAANSGNGGNGWVTLVTNPTLTITMKSVGNVGPFTFTGDNGWASQTITTTASNIGLAGTTQGLTTPGTAVNIAHVIPAGYTMTSVTCTGMASGGTVTPNLAAGSFVISGSAVAFGSDIACTVTDTKTPTIKFQLSTLGNFDGPFTFGTPVNIASAPASITTTALNTPTPATPSSINITTIGSQVQLTQTPVAGYVLTGVNCTDANSTITGNTGNVGTFSGNVLTVAAGKIVAGADLTCVFTDTKTPKVAFQVSTLGNFGGPFAFGTAVNLASAPANISTTAVGSPTPSTPTAINVTTIGSQVQLTETPATGYTLTDVTCLDGNGALSGNSGNVATFAGNVLTIANTKVVAGADIVCVLTNTKTPTLKIQVSTLGNFGGPFVFSTPVNLASTPANITTTALVTNAPASPTAINITTLSSVVNLTETPASGYVLTSLNCTDANSAITTNTGGFATFTGNVITIPAANVVAGADFTCVLTNTKTPTLKLQLKTMGGFNGPFSFTQTNLAATPANITTTVANTATPASPTAINITTAGTAVTVTGTTPAGYDLNAVACTDANASNTGNTGTFGALASNVLTLSTTQAVNGADITCVLTSNKLPTLTLTMKSNGGVNSFPFTGTNGWTSQTIATATPGTGVTGATQTLNAALTATTITQAIPAGYALASTTCTGLGSGTVTANLATGDMLFDITSMAPGAVIACTVTDNKIPTIKFQVSTLGNFGGPFAFGTQVNLASAPGSISTVAVTTPAPVSPTAINITTIGSQVQLTETPASGYVFTGISCTDANSSITGNTGTFGTVASNVLTVANTRVVAGADLTCVLTNTKTPTFKLQVTSLAGIATFTPSAQTNLASTPAAITTTVVNTPTPASPTAINITVAGTAVTVTVPPATNFAMIALSCTDANATNSGNPATAFGSFAGTVITVPATNIVNGADIVCVATESKTQVAFKLVSLGNVGSFAFASNTNLASTPATITTTAVNTAAPASPTPILVTTAGSAVTVTQSATVGTSGYTLTSMSCTDANGTVTGNAGNFGSVASFTGTIPSGNVKAGSDITCVITNTKTPTFKLQVNTGAGFGGPFSFAQTNLASTPSAITTSLANTPTPIGPTAINISALATDATVTGTPPTGFDLNVASCTDANSAITGTVNPFGTFSANKLTVDKANIVAGADITCVLGSHRFPLLTIKETTTGLAGTFTFTGTNGWASQSIGPTTIGTPLSGAPQFLTAINTDTTITQGANPAFVLNGANCTDANNTNTGTTGSFGTLTNADLLIPSADVIYGADIVCAFANQAANPTLLITKTANKPGPVKLGDVITYTYTVKNTGYVAIANVSVTDNHNGKGALSAIGSKALLSDVAPTGDTTDTHPAAGGLWDTLGPGDTITFKSTYTVTQKDVDLLQ